MHLQVQIGIICVRFVSTVEQEPERCANNKNLPTNERTSEQNTNFPMNEQTNERVLAHSSGNKTAEFMLILMRKFTKLHSSIEKLT